MPEQLGVVFTTHAVKRWRERISSEFNHKSARQMVTEARLAHKSERRQLSKCRAKVGRRATVKDAAGVLFVCTEIGEGLLVKTVWKLDQ